MAPSRRKALSLIAGGTVLAAGGAAAGFVATRTPRTALAPWDMAGDYADPRKRALSYALLAPNPHNLQPWEIALEGEDTVTIFHDRNRRLRHTDPFDRQITIGFGCFIEQMVIAASAEGQGVSVTLFPEGPDGPIARAVFTDGATRDPLAGAIKARRSCKDAFDMVPIPREKAAALGAYGTIITDPDLVGDIRDLTWRAWETEALTPRTLQESVDLMRFGKAQINANPDGISLGGPVLEGLMLAGILRRDDQSDPDSAGFRQTVKMYQKMLMATPAYAVLVSDGNSRADQIAAGRKWLRLNLATTTLGLSLHPVSQCLQEYPEMAPHYDRAQALMAKPGQTVQMLGRLGYGPKMPRTPRWPLETKMRKA